MRRLILLLGVCALLLLAVDLGTQALAQENRETVVLRQMQTILPGSESFEEIPYEGGDDAVAAVYRAKGLGYAVLTRVTGYAGDITLLVGVSDDGKVTGFAIQDMKETWGLGREALTDWHFLAQFLNTSGEATVGQNVDALTGATVTSRAVARGVNAALSVVTGADASTGATS